MSERKRVRKMRGSGTHGYGSKKKHRGKGSHGGRGYAGSHKHHFIRTMKNEPDHFGKNGFVSLKRKAKIINIGEVAKISGNEINLTEMGYGKLLSNGEISKPVTVKVALCSKKAKEKIEKAGGKIVE